MKRTLLLVSILLISRLTFGAWLENVPQAIKQPDGTILKCLATGDEYYHWLHDSLGYTIVPNPADGYFYYAIRNGDEVVPSRYVAGTVDPSTVGLERNVRISQQLYNARRGKYNNPLKSLKDAPTTGQVNNISIYITFADDTAFAANHPRRYYYSFYSNDDSVSLRDYFNEASYDRLFIDTYHFPLSPDTINVTYRDPNPRGYYLKKTAANPIGYGDGEDGAREHAMLKRACDFVDSQLPAGVNFDMNNDGNIDNVCFVIQGAAAGWSDLLWPHRWGLYSQDARLRGKRVWDYLLMLESGFGVGTLCHEFFHVLGAPDLYHYNDNGSPDPVGAWDVMCSNQNPPQYMSAFMKQKYGDWIASIPEITESGVYTVYPLQMSENTVYKIKSPFSRQEYFTFEYRKKTGRYESSVPGTGLVIYRINPLAGNGNAGGPPDEVYVYRPGGSLKETGSLSAAAFGSAARKSFNDQTDPDCYLYNYGQGGKGGLDISDITVYPDSATFRVTINHLFPPTDLILTPATGWVSLNWTGSLAAGLATYYVYRNGVRLAATTAENYTDNTIENGVAYTYYVTAYYNGEFVGESVPSNAITYTPMGILSLPYEEDFEESNHGWIIKGNVEGFRWGDAVSLGMETDNTTKFLGASSVAAGPNTDCFDYAITPRLNLSGHTVVNLYFDYSLKRWQQVDHLKLYYRRSSSQDWIPILELPASGIGAGYKWKKYSLELPAEAYTDQAQIGFRYDDGDEFGFGAAIDNVVIREPGAGIETTDLAGQVDLFPNPASDQAFIRITIPGNPEVSVQLCDLSGKILSFRKVRITTGSTVKIDLANLATGMYFVMVSYADNVIIKQLVKSNQ